jgi:quercetin dioxygenase-like cupin family protein
MELDPTTTNPEAYKTIFENDRVRVLEYSDKPGHRTNRHRHPDSVMYTLSDFRRRISTGGRDVEVELTAGTVRWIGAQEHHGENIGDTDSHAVFIELKEPDPAGGASTAEPLGPSAN